MVDEKPVYFARHADGALYCVGCGVPHGTSDRHGASCIYKDAEAIIWYPCCKHCIDHMQPARNMHGTPCHDCANEAMDIRDFARNRILNNRIDSAPHTHGGTDAPECTTCSGQPGYTLIKVGDVTPVIDGASISTGTGTVINSDSMTGPLVESAPDMVNHPPHYNGAVPGIECIDVTRHFNLLRGTAMKYLWRADYKGSKVEDLKKAIWYIQKELETLEDW